MLKDKIIGVDFDGTLAFDPYPACGKPNMRLIAWLNECKRNGCKIILWTCREGKPLEMAVEFCRKNGLEFDSVNENVPELINRYGDCRKIGCDYYIDDTHFTSEYLIAKTKIDNYQERPKARII